MDELTDAIIDNRHRRVGDFLCDKIGVESNLSIVSAYFTIYAYEALRDALGSVGRVRFLYGEPQGVGAMDPKGNEPRAFRLADGGGIEFRRVLAQKALARACAAWIESQVDIRTIRRAGSRARGRFPSNLQPTTCNLQPATCNLQPATCNQKRITRNRWQYPRSGVPDRVSSADWS